LDLNVEQQVLREVSGFEGASRQLRLPRQGVHHGDLGENYGVPRWLLFLCAGSAVCLCDENAGKMHGEQLQ
jgi:hypothetical protein